MHTWETTCNGCSSVTSTPMSISLYPKGSVLLNRSGTLIDPLPYEDQCPTLGTNCCMGMVFQTTKSNVHAQGASLQTTEKTSNEAFLNNLFGKSDLQKMFIQFTP